MVEKTNKEKVLQYFLDNPTKRFHLREMSRETGLSMSTIISITDSLKKQNIIKKEKGKVLTEVFADREGKWFSRLKKSANLYSVYESGLVDFLAEIYNHPQAIVLFGSYARGEDIERSDIDIAVITSKHVELDVFKFEKIHKRDISIHEVSLSKVSEDFKQNLANGIILEGSL